MMPIINKPTRVTNKTATAIDHILTNSYTETIYKTVISKCDVSDHFPIFLYHLRNFYLRIKIFIFTKDHLISNLSSILKRTFGN